MGSGQSHPNANDNKDATPPAPSATTSRTSEKETKAAPTKDESGYARAQRLCRKKKRAYDLCYTAQVSGKGEDCDDLFDTYRTCFLRVISKDMDKRGVKASKDSMIGEYKDDVADDENDR
jgi:hypothetical protein